MSTSASRRSRASLSPFSFVAPVAAVAAVFACGSLASAALPPGYTIEPLLPPGAQHSVKVIDLLDDGRLGIEVSRTTPNTVGNVDAWTRSPAGTWRSAPIPAGNNQINELGAVAADGTMYGTWRVNNNIFDQRVFLSRPDGTFVDLGRYNNSNSFFGAATEQFVAGRSNRGFLYNVATGTSSPLVPLSGDETQLASPFGSNANGWFVGVSPQAAGSGQTRGTAWIPDGAGSFSSANMGMPAGAPAGVTSTARGVSDNNVAVGYFGTFTSNDGFIWDQASGIRALQRNPASNTSHFAYDVNTDELIVGYRSAGSTVTAVIWDGETNAAVDLLPLVQNAAGWHLLDAQEINDSGLILGRGLLNGVNTTFLLTPVPEPAALSLTAAAGAALLLRRRRPCDRR